MHQTRRRPYRIAAVHEAQQMAVAHAFFVFPASSPSSCCSSQLWGSLSSEWASVRPLNSTMPMSMPLLCCLSLLSRYLFSLVFLLVCARNIFFVLYIQNMKHVCSVYLIWKEVHRDVVCCCCPPSFSRNSTIHVS